MRGITQGFYLVGAIVVASIMMAGGCGAPPTNTAVNTTVTHNSNTNTNTYTTTTSTGTTITTSEPEKYQGTVKLTLETLGGEGQQKASMPAIGAVVARSGADRVMEFTLPTGEKVIYLDKGGTNYVILPTRKQFAELTKEALGFEVRRLLMPEQMVQQVKAIPGVRLSGEETFNGRPVVKYVYSATSNTQTQAGTVATESYVLVDKDTTLPVRSETISQSQSGGNVQGVSGLRVVTEMTDITTSPDESKFVLPTDYQKIDPEQVKAQANLIFQAVAALVGQVVKQASTTALPSNATPAMSPTASPMR